jgi:hypothetical protein
MLTSLLILFFILQLLLLRTYIKALTYKKENNVRLLIYYNNERNYAHIFKNKKFSE